MKFLRFLFHFYIQGSIHVALAIVALSLLSGYYLNISIDNKLLGFIFFAAISGYNFVKYASIAKWHHRRLSPSLKTIQMVSLFAFFAMVFFFWQLPIGVQFIAVFSGFLTLLYAIPLKRKWKNFRSIPGLKLVLTALVLVLTTVIMPVFYVNSNFERSALILCFLRFLWVIVLILPFEIRDLDVDDISLGTIPQKFGVFKSKVFGSILLVILVVAEIYFSIYIHNTIWAALIVGLVTSAFLWKSSKKKLSFYFTAFWVETVPLFWLLLEVIFRG